jgi:hypothetical protein
VSALDFSTANAATTKICASVSKGTQVKKLGNEGNSWWSWLQAKIYYREAHALIDGKAAAPAVLPKSSVTP